MSKSKATNLQAKLLGKVQDIDYELITNSKGRSFVDADVPLDDYFDSKAVSSVRAYFGRVAKGDNHVYDTPFAKGESTEDLISAWSSVLESLATEWPELLKYEIDQSEKIGPASVMQPGYARLDDVAAYYLDILHPGEPLHPSAISATLREWAQVKGLRIRSDRNTLNKMKVSTSSGVPYFTKKSEVKDSVLRENIHRNEGVVGVSLTIQGVNRRYAAGSMLGWRGQMGGPSKKDVKQRVVWMFPFAVNLQELRAYQPLIESAQKFQLVPAWVSNELVDKRITDLFDSKPKSDLIVCTDFTAFDQHFNKNLQSAVRSIYMKLLNKDQNSFEWLAKIFPIKYDIPMIVGVNPVNKRQCIVFEGHHGMASGSGGTNCDETLLHRTLQYEAAIVNNQKLNPNSQCLGDDGILSYPGITVKDVTDAYSKHGLEMNESKQYASSHDCIYLRRWHHVNYRKNGICVGVYPTFRALGKLRYLERWQDPDVWTPEAVALRQLSIIENCKYHPLFIQFIEFCMQRDKYRLGIDIPGFLDKLPELVTTDGMDAYISYTQSLQDTDPTHGIAEWEVVKYLKSKS